MAIGSDESVKTSRPSSKPPEAEGKLREHPGILDAAILFKEQEYGGTRLIAFIVPRPEKRPSSLELSDYLKAHLPNQYVPSAFVMLEALPRSQDGTPDIQSLSDLAWDGNAVVFSPPATELEKTLCAIFARELNGLNEIGVHHNFFELGGDSLSAIRTMIAVEAEVGIRISASKLFEQPTVRELAHYIESGSACDDQAHVDEVGTL